VFGVGVVLSLTALVAAGVALTRSSHKNRHVGAAPEVTTATSGSPLAASTPAELANGLRERGIPCTGYFGGSSSVLPASGNCDSNGATLGFWMSSDTGYEDSSLTSVACPNGTEFKLVYVNGSGWSIFVSDPAEYVGNPLLKTPKDPNNIAQNAADRIASATGATTRILTPSDC
jgi:hypothetical protein